MSNVVYKGVRLGKSSDAYAMWEKKDFKKLDQHLKQLDQNNIDLLKRYEKKQ